MSHHYCHFAALKMNCGPITKFLESEVLSRTQICTQKTTWTLFFNFVAVQFDMIVNTLHMFIQRKISTTRTALDFFLPTDRERVLPYVVRSFYYTIVIDDALIVVLWTCIFEMVMKKKNGKTNWIKIMLAMFCRLREIRNQSRLMKKKWSHIVVIMNFPDVLGTIWTLFKDSCKMNCNNYPFCR